MAFSRIMYYNRAFPLPDLLGSGVYAGGSLEIGRVKDSFVPPADTGKLYSGSVFLGADTFLGLRTSASAGAAADEVRSICSSACRDR
jgi:NTE family protein